MTEDVCVTLTLYDRGTFIIPQRAHTHTQTTKGAVARRRRAAEPDGPLAFP